MSSDTIAISRELLAAGMEQKMASAVAVAIVKHSDNRYADKVEAESNLKEEVHALRNQLNAFEAKTNEFQAKAMESQAKTNEFQAVANSRFNFIGVLLIATFASVFVIMMQIMLNN